MTTQDYNLDHDVNVYTVTAHSFPAGVKDAFDRLSALIPPATKANMWGISRPEKGTIMYKAAAELPGYNGELPGCDTFTISKGKYTSIALPDFMKDTRQVGTAFQQLLQNLGIDPNGCCVEQYLNERDVVCMVRLKD